jgi:hypothetical protein
MRTFMRNQMSRESWDTHRVMRAGAALIGLALLTWAIGCASLPAKQRAVTSLQTVDTALTTAKTLVETNHTLFGLDVAATPAQIAYCDQKVLLPATLPPTPSKFNVVGCVLAMAFDAEYKAGAALTVWQAGQPTPFLTTLKTEVDVLFGFAEAVVQSPAATQLLTTVQLAVDTTLSIMQMLNPGGA